VLGGPCTQVLGPGYQNFGLCFICARLILVGRKAAMEEGRD